MTGSVGIDGQLHGGPCVGAFAVLGRGDQKEPVMSDTLPPRSRPSIAASLGSTCQRER